MMGLQEQLPINCPPADELIMNTLQIMKSLKKVQEREGLNLTGI